MVDILNDLVQGKQGEKGPDAALFKLGQQRAASLAKVVGIDLAEAHILLWPLEFLERFHNRFMMIQQESEETTKRLASLEIKIEALMARKEREKDAKEKDPVPTD